MNEIGEAWVLLEGEINLSVSDTATTPAAAAGDNDCAARGNGADDRSGNNIM